MDTSENKQSSTPVIEGTNIPTDPRKRTKNHARLEVTLWAEVSDTTLKYSKHPDATSFLRNLGDAIKKDMADVINGINMIPLIGDIELHIETRVSQ